MQSRRPVAIVHPRLKSSLKRISHNNYEIHSEHLRNKRAERDSSFAKMLVVQNSGEQRLITFSLPRVYCTVHDLLEQIGKHFNDTTTICCFESKAYDNCDIDFVVTLGFSIPEESVAQLIARFT